MSLCMQRETKSDYSNRTTGSRYFLGVFRADPHDDSAERLEHARIGLPPESYDAGSPTIHQSDHLVLYCRTWTETPGTHNGETHHLAGGLSGCITARQGLHAPADLAEPVERWLLRSLAPSASEPHRNPWRHIDGPWLCAVADPMARVGTLARDRLGQKHLYYFQQDGRLWFSDDLRPLLSIVHRRDVRTLGLLEWMYYGSPLDPGTLFSGISSLPPGHLLRYDWTLRRLHIETYYEPADDISAPLAHLLGRCGPDELQDRLEKQFRSSVRCCIGGLPAVSTLLSGGVDSSLMTAFAAERAHVQAIHVDVQGASERAYAAAVARRVGAELVVCPFDAADYRRNVCDTVYAICSPIIINYYVALQELTTRRLVPDGQRILDGICSDALYGGLTRSFQSCMTHYFLSRLPGMSRARAQRLLSRMRRHLARLGLPTRAATDPDGLNVLLWARGMERAVRFQQLMEKLKHVPRGPQREMAALMLQEFYGQGLLKQLENWAKSTGSDLVLPFLQSDLFRFSLNLPLNAKIRWDWRRMRPAAKWIEKRLALRYLPRHVINRPKGGFHVPGGEWIGPMPQRWLRDSWLAEQFELPGGVLRAWLEMAGHSHDRVFVTTLEIWGRLFARGESLDAVKEEWLQP